MNKKTPISVGIVIAIAIGIIAVVATSESESDSSQPENILGDTTAQGKDYRVSLSDGVGVADNP